MDQGMNRPRGKWPVGKRKPPQSDEHVSIFIENSYGLVRFGFSTGNSPSVPKKLPKHCFFVEKPAFTTFLGSLLGI